MNYNHFIPNQKSMKNKQCYKEANICPAQFMGVQFLPSNGEADFMVFLTIGSIYNKLFNLLLETGTFLFN